MLVGEGLGLFLMVAFWIWALFDCISTDGAMCRNLPKGVWLILVLLLPLIGSIAWLLLGRPERAGWRPRSSDGAIGQRPPPIEDQPRYSVTPAISDRRSAELDHQLEEWERQRALETREQGLRDREDDLDAGSH